MSQTQLVFEGSLAVLSLVRPGGNRISFEMRRELRHAIRRVAASNARALLVRGEGADFCLGGDVSEWPDVPVDELRHKIEVFAEALDLLSRLEIPTLAAIQGGCSGGGLELALTCDLVVASQSAWFSCPEATLGILTLQGGMLQLADRIGRSRAAELIFLSEKIPVAQFHAWNMVNWIVEDSSLEHFARDMAMRLASGPTLAYGATKRLWRTQAESGERAARDALYDHSMPLFETEDARVALRSAADALAAGRPRPTIGFKGK